VGIARILGFVLVVAGSMLLVSAYRATGSFSERALEKVTGRYSDRTQRDLILGGAGVAGGVLLIAFGGGRRRR
jgi:ascorbate-specific PTS system EIIC-type component UlaA